MTRGTESTFCLSQMIPTSSHVSHVSNWRLVNRVISAIPPCLGSHRSHLLRIDVQHKQGKSELDHMLRGKYRAVKCVENV